VEAGIVPPGQYAGGQGSKSVTFNSNLAAPTGQWSPAFAARAELTDIMQDSTMLSQKSLRWRRALSPRKASLPHEDWVLRGLTLHQLKDIITDVYASKAKADVR